eukprot:COSAG05_NODE_1849_length_3965_cov_10.605018_3_plen_148_part_00
MHERRAARGGHGRPSDRDADHDHGRRGLLVLFGGAAWRKSFDYYHSLLARSLANNTQNCELTYSTSNHQLLILHHLYVQCFVFVGSRKPGGELFPHHHPSFDIDEDSLLVGPSFFVALVESLLGPEAALRSKDGGANGETVMELPKI